jgi:hypothetical protein
MRTSMEHLAIALKFEDHVRQGVHSNIRRMLSPPDGASPAA